MIITPRFFNRLKKGDSAAWDELRRAYQPSVLRAAGKIVKNREDAEDVASYVWLQAWRHIREIREPNYLKTWLLRCAWNAALTHYRGRKHERAKRVEWNDARTWDIRVVDADPLARREVLRLLALLPPQHSLPVALRYLEGFSIQDAARRLGITENAVKLRVYRGLAALRALMLEEP